MNDFDGHGSAENVLNARNAHCFVSLLTISRQLKQRLDFISILAATYLHVVRLW